MSIKKIPEFAIFEDKLTNKQNFCFINPVEEVIATDENSLNKAFERLLELQQQGLYLAGYISYEASFYINKNLSDLQSSKDGILLYFVAFSDKTSDIPAQDSQANIDLFIDSLSFKDYQKGFSKVQQALVDGESYQINYTKMLQARSKMTGLELYTKLKELQPVNYAAYLPFKDNEIISISPELFFQKQADDIIVRPMKGTARLTNDESQNKQIYSELKNCFKNKAENLIIVDLLRNDLCGIAANHSLKVTKAFEIEKYNGLLQMTSEIKAKISNNISLKEILLQLFPCGSITGAPKKRTMEIIKKVELENRGVYTGSIGYILPNNDMCFNVAIRTVQKQGDRLKIGVGGGITVYSDIDSEWQEKNTKINFIKKIYKPSFTLVESLYFSNNSFSRLGMHLKRLNQTAQKLLFEIDIKTIESALKTYAKNNLVAGKQYKLRLEYNYSQEFKIEHFEIAEQENQIIKLQICPQKINSANKLFNYKTTDSSTRGFYTQMQQKYIQDDKFKELIYFNQDDYVTETRFHNIVIKKDSKMYTPKITDGVLDGVYRRYLIESEKVLEKSITRQELEKADKIYLINSVKGMIPAQLDY